MQERRSIDHAPALFCLGDMAVAGRPQAKLMKALAVIADTLHPTLEANPDVIPGISKRSCILCSLAVRDFLHKIGFPSARCEPCYLAVFGLEDGKVFHSAGVAGGPLPGLQQCNGWPCHLIVSVDGYIIDTTLYQVQRRVWPELPGMMAVPSNWSPTRAVVGEVHDLDAPGRLIEVHWIPRPTDQSWKDAPDARRDRRRSTINAMVEKMKGWRP